MNPTRLFFAGLLMCILGCGSNKTSTPQPATIAGKWHVVTYEMKQTDNPIMNLTDGEWVFEFDTKDKLQTTQSGKQRNCTYTIKNDHELWINDMGSYHPYRIVVFKPHEMVLESDMEKLTLTR